MSADATVSGVDGHAAVVGLASVNPRRNATEGTDTVDPGALPPSVIAAAVVGKNAGE
jgi:hypothetical protein